jgi:predicted DNA-binding transcriptional regulator AlpA
MNDLDLVPMIDIAKMTGRGVPTIRRWVRLGHLPQPEVAHANARLWRRSTIEAALKRLAYSTNGKRMEGTAP